VFAIFVAKVIGETFYIEIWASWLNALNNSLALLS